MLVGDEPLQCDAEEDETFMHKGRTPNQGSLSLGVQFIVSCQIFTRRRLGL
jgi:hypothetical protein